MADSKYTIINGYAVGGINPETGRVKSYKPITEWEDGSTMSDKRVDGRIYIKIDNTYYKQSDPLGYSNRVNVIELGLVADGVTRNELKLAYWMNKLPKGTTFFFPAAPKPYLFGPLPAKYNNFEGTPTAINRDVTDAHFQGEGENSILSFLPGCIGIQVTGGIGKAAFLISDITLVGSGEAGNPEDGKVTYNGQYFPNTTDYNLDYGRTIGDWSILHLNYKYNGINAWAQSTISNVNVRGFSGHGVSILGSPDLRPDGVPFDLVGRFHEEAIGRFYPNDPSDVSSVKFGWKIRIHGKNGNPDIIGYVGNNPVDYIGISNVNFSGSDYTISVTPKGGGLIADNTDIYGGNFDFNGGAGLTISGADGNQTRWFGGSIRENGWWGINDASFLGSFFYGTHGSRNGKNFNILTEDHTNESLIVGSFYTPTDTAASAYYGCYTEQNQGPSYIGANASIIDGLHGATVIGPGFRRLGKSTTNLIAGIAYFEGNRIRYPYGEEGRAALEMKRWPSFNNEFGYGFVDRPSFIITDSTTNIERSNGSNRILGRPGIHLNQLSIGGIVTRGFARLSDYITELATQQFTAEVGDILNLYEGGNNLPHSYVCYKGGDYTAMRLQPTNYGIGEINSRPATNLLSSIHDIGYRWYDPSTNSWTTFNGISWI